MPNILRTEVSTKNLAANLKWATILSFLIVMPLMVLDFLFNPLRRQNSLDQIVLFGLLWLLPIAFITILVPLVRSARAGNSSRTRPVTVLISVTVLILIAVTWGWIVMDQLPCFMGRPNCD